MSYCGGYGCGWGARKENFWKELRSKGKFKEDVHADGFSAYLADRLGVCVEDARCFHSLLRSITAASRIREGGSSGHNLRKQLPPPPLGAPVRFTTLAFPNEIMPQAQRNGPKQGPVVSL